jgi:hypothetical protein
MNPENGGNDMFNLGVKPREKQTLPNNFTKFSSPQTKAAEKSSAAVLFFCRGQNSLFAGKHIDNYQYGLLI